MLAGLLQYLISVTFLVSHGFCEGFFFFCAIVGPLSNLK